VLVLVLVLVLVSSCSQHLRAVPTPRLGTLFTPYGTQPHESRNCMHASIACLLLYEDYVWVSLGNAMKAKQSKANRGSTGRLLVLRIDEMYAADYGRGWVANLKPACCLQWWTGG
jgi:hypothetical protein